KSRTQVSSRKPRGSARRMGQPRWSKPSTTSGGFRNFMVALKMRRDAGRMVRIQPVQRAAREGRGVGGDGSVGMWSLGWAWGGEGSSDGDGGPRRIVLR